MNIKDFQGAAPGNPRSEQYDAFRFTLYEERARLDYGSVADQVTRNIESVLDVAGDDMEPLFVY